MSEFTDFLVTIPDINPGTFDKGTGGYIGGQNLQQYLKQWFPQYKENWEDLTSIGTGKPPRMGEDPDIDYRARALPRKLKEAGDPNWWKAYDLNPLEAYMFERNKGMSLENYIKAGKTPAFPDMINIMQSAKLASALGGEDAKAFSDWYRGQAIKSQRKASTGGNTDKMKSLGQFLTVAGAMTGIGLGLAGVGAGTGAAGVGGTAGGAGSGFSFGATGGLNLTGAGSLGTLGANTGAGLGLTSAANAAGWGSTLGTLAASGGIPSLSEGQLLAKDTLLGKGTWADLGTGPSSTSNFFQSIAKQINPLYDFTSVGSKGMSFFDTLWGGVKEKFSDPNTWLDLAGNLYGSYQGRQTAKELASSTQRASAADIEMQQRALDLQERMYADAIAKQMPFYTAGLGALEQYMEQLPYEGEIPEYTPLTMEEFQQDPGYQFRLSEGQRAIERSAAARGTLGTSGALKAIERFAQGTAAQEFTAARGRHLEDYKTQVAREMEEYSRNRGVLSGLQNLITMGSGSSQQLANIGANYGSSAGNILANIGATRGSGIQAAGEYGAMAPSWLGGLANWAGNQAEQSAQNKMLIKLLGGQ